MNDFFFDNHCDSIIFRSFRAGGFAANVERTIYHSTIVKTVRSLNNF